MNAYMELVGFSNSNKVKNHCLTCMSLTGVIIIIMRKPIVRSYPDCMRWACYWHVLTCKYVPFTTYLHVQLYMIESACDDSCLPCDDLYLPCDNLCLLLCMSIVETHANTAHIDRYHFVVFLFYVNLYNLVYKIMLFILFKFTINFNGSKIFIDTILFSSITNFTFKHSWKQFSDCLITKRCNFICLKKRTNFSPYADNFLLSYIDTIFDCFQNKRKIECRLQIPILRLIWL